MKKYVKPVLFYEHYELSEQIAACAYDLNYADESSCRGNGYLGTDVGYPSDMILIGEVGVDGCQIVPEMYCYQPGSGDNFSTFNS